MYWWVEWKVPLNITIISYFPDTTLLHFGIPFVILVFALSQLETYTIPGKKTPRQPGWHNLIQSTTYTLDIKEDV